MEGLGVGWEAAWEYHSLTYFFRVLVDAGAVK